MPVYVCWYQVSEHVNIDSKGVPHRTPVPPEWFEGLPESLVFDFRKQVFTHRQGFILTTLALWFVLRRHQTYLERLYLLTKCEIAACTVSNHISSVTVALFVCPCDLSVYWSRQECRPISRFPADKSRWVTRMTQPYQTIMGSSWNSASIKAPWTSQAAVSLLPDPP